MEIRVITLVFFLSISNFDGGEGAGFTIDLIHRDSLQSPSFNSSYEIVKTMLQRSNLRANLIGGPSPQSSASAYTDLLLGSYLMRFAIGTPMIPLSALIETAFDLTWIQCKPCKKCFKQLSPMFSSNKSSSYVPIPCRSDICRATHNTSCQGTNGGCSYTHKFLNGYLSKGDVATETIILGTNVFNRVVIGCGRMNKCSFPPEISGIVGLGDGKTSLIRQMGPSFGGKFSYCFIPFFLEKKANRVSKMHFGDAAVVSGAGVVTTSIVPKAPLACYHLSLVGVSVGNQRFNLVDSGEKFQEGNIIIDAGTTITYLPKKLYLQVEAAVRRQVNLKTVKDQATNLSLCFDPRKIVLERIPEITVHFKGADVKLKTYNTFMTPSYKSFCFAFAQAKYNLSIYGNLAQLNFLVGYDLVKKTVSFKPSDCT